MSNKFNEELYDISQYDDKELYEVLDLFNPSDRELEAKIIFYINKYTAIENGASLVKFFEDVYKHFFDIDSDDEPKEGFENINAEYVDEANANYVSNIFKTQGYINSGNTVTENNISSPASIGSVITGNIIADNTQTSGVPEYEVTYDDNKKPSEDNIAKSSSINKDVAFTTTLDYAKGQLNPLLKQTTTRILSVDSQYREDKSSLTTSFTFDLSEPLRDVVSLKLYSFQIPYTWYTIGKGFGSNFFYLKGATSGINNGNHDIQISINPGNYSPSELSTAVDNAIATSKSIYTDVNFGTTKISYNANTSLSTLTIDIDNLYNENSYYLNFPEFKSPYQLDNNRKTSIPSFLGFQTGNYSTNSIKSTITLPLLTNGNTITTNIEDVTKQYVLYNETAIFNASISGTTMTVSLIVSGTIYIGQTMTGTGVISGTTITAKISGTGGIGTYSVSLSHLPAITSRITANSANNYFTIIKYIGPGEYYIDNVTPENSSVIDKQFDVFFSLTTPGLYSRNDLVLDLSNQLHNSIYLDNTYKIGSSITRRNIDPSNNGYNVDNPNFSYYELKIKPNRKTTNNIDNSKIAIKFPTENQTLAQTIVSSGLPVWRGKTSCFVFDALYSSFETNNIYSEENLLNEQQIFTINDNAYIYLKCVHEGFILPENDITIHIPFYNKASDGITFLPYPDLNSYIAAINQGIKNADITYGGSLNTANFGGTGGTNAYIDTNGYFNIYLDVEKTFDESTYIMDFTNSIFNTNNIKIVDDVTNSPILTDLTKTYTTFVNTGGLFVNSNTILAVIKPKTGSTAGNRNDVTYTLTFGYDKSYTDYTFFETDVNARFNNYVDPISGRNIFSGIDLTHTITPTGYQIFLNIKIAKKLVAKNYSVNFSDTPPTTGTWYASWRNYLFIDTSMFNQDYNLEAAFNSSIRPIKNKDEIEILTINEYKEVTAKGIAAIEDNKLTIQRGVNNIINIIAYEDGVETTDKTNDLIIDILNGTNSNTRDVTTNNLINIVNAQFNNSAYFKGSALSTYYIGNKNYLKIRMNVNRKYRAKDYKLVFYDEVSFVKCYVGTTSVQNTTWDSTLGWILGYREYTSYSLTDTTLYSSASGLYSINENTNIVTIIGDTGVCTNLYNYFLICLDDYNQNHLNDGLVTITNRDNNIALPSYGSKTSFACDPASGQLTYNTALVTDGSQLTAKQIYALTAIANNQYNTEAMGTSVPAKSYGTGPFAKDVFAILPMKVAGLANGSSYMEYGGTLQNQSRNYFGPVNIRRMSVSLISDRGNKVDLNNANWSFSIICEQLNKLTPAK